MLLTIPNVLSTESVRAIRDQLDQEQWQEGSVTAGGVARRVKHNQQLSTDSIGYPDLANRVLDAVNSNLLFVSATLPKKIFTPNFNQYQQGGSYGAHVDGSLMQMAGKQQLLRTDVSSTLFLTDPEEYSGGELRIETQYDTQEIKLAAGEMDI